MATKEKSILALFIDKYFPGEKFQSKYLKLAGKKLAKEGEEATKEYLTGKGEKEPPGDGKSEASSHTRRLLVHEIIGPVSDTLGAASDV